MASYKVGQFLARNGTGSQSVTGIGFQPKALVLWGQLLSGTAGLAGFEWSNYGITDGSSQFGGSATENDMPAATSDVHSAISTQVLHGISYVGGGEMVAGISSLDADGFTLGWIINLYGSICAYNYLAIGGADVSCKVGTFNASTSLSSQPVTGVGFEPELLLGFYTHGTFDDARQSFGWCDAGLRHVVSLTNARNAQNPSRTRRLHRTDGMFVLVDSSVDTVTALGAIGSFDSDGFTVNWVVQPASANPVYYLAVRGLRARSGAFTQPSVTGNQATTGVGFAPDAVLFQSIGLVTGTGLLNGMRFTRSGMDATDQVSAWCGSENGVSPVSSARAYSNNTAIELWTERATLNAEATRTSLDSDGFTLNWTTVDATARNIAFLALGQPLAPVVISPTTLPDANGAYGEQLSATGGIGAPYTFTVTAGSLPTGLTMSSAGLISGTAPVVLPATLSDGEVDTFYSVTFSVSTGSSFTVRATDGDGNFGEQAFTLGMAWSAATATWGVAPGSSLPSCLTCSTAGVLSGYPMRVGVFTFSIRATDGVGRTVTRSYTLTTES